MIDYVLILLREEMSAYMTSQGDPVAIVVENISQLGSENATALSESVIISVVNIEQENTLKNQAAFQKTESSAIYRNPPVHLNLYILISANFNSGTSPNNGYILALRRLALAVQFFQAKTQFSATGSPVPLPPPLNDPLNEDISSLKFTMELFSLSFEQVNYLWGSLGGRQIPFVLYKARTVMITERRALREAPLIEEVEILSKGS